MKKLVASLLIILYSMASMGANIVTHFCMGDPMDTSLGYAETALCSECPMSQHMQENPEDCCTAENTFVKVLADQDYAPALTVPSVPVFTVNFILPELNALTFSDTDHHSEITGSDIPPKIPIYQRNCIYRI